MKTLQFPHQTKFYRGKVRDVVYPLADNLLVMVASDRISAFDVILPRPIPFKGQVKLNQIAAYMLKATSVMFARTGCWIRRLRMWRSVAAVSSVSGRDGGKG